MRRRISNEIMVVGLSAYAMGVREQIVLETNDVHDRAEDFNKLKLIARLNGRALQDSTRRDLITSIIRYFTLLLSIKTGPH